MKHGKLCAKFARYLFLCPLLVFVLCLVSAAQETRRPSAPRQNVGHGAETATVVIHEITGVGAKWKEKTPIYNTDVSRSVVPAKDWGVVTVTYDTSQEWIDELVFQYYVLLLKGGSKKEYTLLKGSVAHIDIKLGRKHKSTMFVRPSTIERYGDIVAVAVEISMSGKEVASLSVPEKWRTSKDESITKLTAKDGYLLNRSQTPFAFVNFDDYEAIK